MDGRLINDSPPATNRGANFKSAEAHFDYLACNFGRKQPEFPAEIKNDFRPVNRFGAWEMVSQNSQGVRVCETPSKPEWGHYVILSGGVLPQIELDDDSLLTHFFLRAKMRRIDVCVDIRNHKLSLNEIRRQIRAGKAITRAKQFPTRGDAKLPNDTVYAGRMSGDVYTKIYDKGIESKQGGDWKRIETTYQGDRVIPATKQYLSGVGIIGLIKGHFDLPDYGKWNTIMAEEPKHVKAEKKTENKTEQWLLSAAAHTLAAFCAQQGGLDFKNRFDDEFYQVYNAIMGLNQDGTKSEQN